MRVRTLSVAQKYRRFAHAISQQVTSHPIKQSLFYHQPTKSLAFFITLHCDIQTFTEYAVAPHVGAWIETLRLANMDLEALSRPTWARGLKQILLTLNCSVFLSRPTWARGLKLLLVVFFRIKQMSRPTWARGLKRALRCQYEAQEGRAPRGRVD